MRVRDCTKGVRSRSSERSVSPESDGSARVIGCWCADKRIVHVNLHEIEEKRVVCRDDTFFSRITITLNLFNEVRKLDGFGALHSPEAWMVHAEPRR